MTTHCPSCNAALRLPESVAIRRARCPVCGNSFPVDPGAAQARPPQPLPVPPSPRLTEPPEVTPPTVPVPERGPLEDLTPADVDRRTTGSTRFLVGVLGGLLGIAVGVCVLLFVVLKGKGSLSGFAPYVPEQAVAVAYVNFQRLRQSELYPHLKPALEAAQKRPGSPLHGFPVALEDINELFVAGAEPSEAVAVVRTANDPELTSFLGGAKATKTHEGIAYAETVFFQDKAYVAKTAPRTFCSASTEAALQGALSRLSRRQTAAAVARFEGLLARVKSHDHWFVLPDLAKMPSSKQRPAMPVAPDLSSFGLTGAAVGVSADATLRVDAVLSFGDAARAKSFAEMADAMLRAYRASLELKMPSAKGTPREVTDAGLALLKSIRVSQSRTLVSLTASAKVGDLTALFDKLGQLLREQLIEAFTPKPGGDEKQPPRGPGFGPTKQ